MATKTVGRPKTVIQTAENQKDVKALVKYYRDKDIEPKEIVFSNGRSDGRGGRPPHVADGYRDYKTKVIVKYKDSVLYDMEGNRIMVPNSDGQADVPQRYGLDLKFTSNPSVVLHPIVHFDLVRKIRNDSTTATPFKATGYPKILAGKIVEFVPNIKADEKFNQYQLKLKATMVLGTLQESGNERTLNYVLALTKNVGRRSNDNMNGLFSYVESNPKAFMDLFKSTELSSLELKPGYINSAIVTMAIKEKVITMSNGQWFIGDIPLGTSSAKIHIEYESNMNAIKAELDNAVK